MAAQVGRVGIVLNIGVGELAQASARSAKITQAGMHGMSVCTFDPAQVSYASRSGSTDLILRALIEGRSVSQASSTPTSLLEVFRNPDRYRDQSLTGLLTEIAGRLQLTVETDLKQRPLTSAGLESLKGKIESLGLPANKEAIQMQI